MSGLKEKLACAILTRYPREREKIEACYSIARSNSRTSLVLGFILGFAFTVVIITIVK
jgi:hypothetical protein